MENFPAGSATDTEKCHCHDRNYRYHRCSCLYAWFNIAASWDPYENTGNLKVAVASVDEGYEGSIIPIKLTSAIRYYPHSVKNAAEQDLPQNPKP